jgi:hypothetical protein
LFEPGHRGEKHLYWQALQIPDLKARQGMFRGGSVIVNSN